MELLGKLKLPFLAAIAWLAPIQGAIISTFALVMIDLILGLLAARKTNVPITSSGLKQTVLKLLAYELGIVLAFIVQTYLAPQLAAVGILTTLIGTVELKSLLENIDIITGGDFFKSILSKFQ